MTVSSALPMRNQRYLFTYDLARLLYIRCPYLGSDHVQYLTFRMPVRSHVKMKPARFVRQVRQKRHAGGL